jgi:hypothetical protein
MESQRVVGGSVEIRALPALLPARTQHVERTVLPSASADTRDAAAGGDTLSVRVVPLQFRQFPALPGTVRKTDELAREV